MKLRHLGVQHIDTVLQRPDLLLHRCCSVHCLLLAIRAEAVEQDAAYLAGCSCSLGRYLCVKQVAKPGINRLAVLVEVRTGGGVGRLGHLL